MGLSRYICVPGLTTSVKSDGAALKDTREANSQPNYNGLNNHVLDLEARIVFNLKICIPLTFDAKRVEYNI